MSLDKILGLSQNTAGATPPGVDPAGLLVMAASSALRELFVMLASDPDDDGDDDSKEGGPGDTDNDAGHTSHPTFKRLKKQGVPDAKAAQMCAKADKKVQATNLAEAALIALGGLAAPAPETDWVELTAFDQRAYIALAGAGAKMPYGDVEYADPGYQEDGKKRYPVDTEEHVRAALSYINQESNGDKYSPEHLATIKSRIRRAARKHGIQVGDEERSEKVAATMVALAMRQAESLQAMHHGPHTGKHSHGHMHQVVSGEEHFHNNDNDHSRHTPVSSRDMW